MLKTDNYQLNRPEAADPIRVDDFNENAEIIDTALKQVDDNSVTRSAQVRSEAAGALAAYKTTNDAAVDALTTAVAALNAAAVGFGNCKIATGTYTGTGKTGSANPTTIEVGFAPKLAIINFEHAGDKYCRMFVWPVIKHDLCSSFTSAEVTQIWGETSFGQYCATSAFGQMNNSGYTYSYIVIG